MNSDSSNTERCIRVEFLPREKRSWCAGATRPGDELPIRGATGWTTFLRMPKALRKRLKKAEPVPPAAPTLESTPAALPARADGPDRTAEPAPATHDSRSREGSDPVPGRASQEEDAR